MGIVGRALYICFGLNKLKACIWIMIYVTIWFVNGYVYDFMNVNWLSGLSLVGVRAGRVRVAWIPDCGEPCSGPGLRRISGSGVRRVPDRERGRHKCWYQSYRFSRAYFESLDAEW